MIELTTSNLDKFLERFSHCYDGLIRDVRINFPTKKVSITCSVKDQNNQVDEGWVNLTLEIENMIELTVVERQSTCIVLSDGLQVGFFNDQVYLDLCPYTEEPDSIDDFKKSDFLVVGERCSWSLAAYNEHIL